MTVTDKQLETIRRHLPETAIERVEANADGLENDVVVANERCVFLLLPHRADGVVSGDAAMRKGTGW
jgi:hypothetical protein